MSVDGTQNASSNAPSVSSSNNGNQNIDTRARVMQIMSSTMNGCLDELGYSPAMHQQLQALEIANAQLKTENAKLFSDNANLAHLIYIQNETIAANDHSQSIRELRNHVRLLEGDRQTLLSKYQQAVQEVMALRERLARPRRPSSAPKMPTAPDPRSGGQSSVPQISGHHGQVPVAMRPNMFVPRERYPTETFRQDIPTPRAVLLPMAVGSAPSRQTYMMSPFAQPPISPTTSTLQSQHTSPMLSSSGVSTTGGRSPSIPLASTTQIAENSPTMPSPSGLVQNLIQGPDSRSTGTTPRIAMIDLTLEGDSVEAPRKKRRLDSEMLPAVPSGPVSEELHEAVVQPAPTHAEPAESEPIQVEPAHTEIAQAASAHVEPAPTDPQVSVDQDESQFVQDCLEQNFDEDEEENGVVQLTCCMCRTRYLRGITTEAPQPFVDATLEELVEHCEREHPIGWETLKKLIKEHRLKDEAS